MKKMTIVIISLLVISGLIGCNLATEQETILTLPASLNSSNEETQTEGSKEAENKNREPDEQTDTMLDPGLPVSNNGHFFVKIGNQIFYRYFEPDTVDIIALEGEMYGNPMACDSVIMSYDEATKTSKEAFEDQGYGNLFYQGGYFYMSKVDEDGSQKFYCNNLNGSDRIELGSGSILALSEDGRYLMVTKYGEGDKHYVIYEIVAPGKIEERDSLNYEQEYITCLEQSVYYFMLEEGELTVAFYEKPLGKDEILLGKFTNPYKTGEMESDGLPSEFRVGQVLEHTDNLFYVRLDSYVGVSPYYDREFFVELDYGKNPKVTLLDPRNLPSKCSVEYEEYTDAWMGIWEDEVILMDKLPNQAFAFREEEESKIAVTNVEGKIQEPFWRSEHYGQDCVLELVDVIERIGDKVYTISHLTIPNPTKSAEWEYAYDCLTTSYRIFDVGNIEQYETIQEISYDRDYIVNALWLEDSNHPNEKYILFEPYITETGGKGKYAYIGTLSEDLIYDSSMLTKDQDGGSSLYEWLTKTQEVFRDNPTEAVYLKSTNGETIESLDVDWPMTSIGIRFDINGEICYSYPLNYQ